MAENATENTDGGLGSDLFFLKATFVTNELNIILYLIILFSEKFNQRGREMILVVLIMKTKMIRI